MLGYLEYSVFFFVCLFVCLPWSKGGKSEFIQSVFGKDSETIEFVMFLIYFLYMYTCRLPLFVILLISLKDAYGFKGIFFF